MSIVCALFFLQISFYVFFISIEKHVTWKQLAHGCSILFKHGHYIRLDQYQISNKDNRISNNNKNCRFFSSFTLNQKEREREKKNTKSINKNTRFTHISRPTIQLPNHVNELYVPYNAFASDFIVISIVYSGCWWWRFFARGVSFFTIF